MSKMVFIPDHWKEFYDQEAKYAARNDSGVFGILGMICSILESNSRGDLTSDETLEHIRYCLRAYDEARGFEPDIQEDHTTAKEETPCREST